MNERKKIFRTLITLSLPTILEQVLSTLMQYVDTAMVGHLGEQATASVSVTTTVTWLVGSVPSALSVGVLALVARALGSGDREKIQKLAMQTLYMAVAAGIVLGGICLALSPFIPQWMGAEDAICGPASRYFQIISLPMIFRMGSSLFGAAVRATKDTRTPMFISLSANVLNAVLNVVFIYGMGLGVNGAALASAIAYTVSGILMFLAYRKNRYLHFAWKELKMDRKLLLECMQLSVPVLLTSVAACLGYVVFASLVTSMGSTVFAAHSIAVTAEEIFYIPGYGLRTATSTLVGISLGENDRKKFEHVSSISIWVTLGMTCISGIVLYLVAAPLMSVFTNSRAVVDLGAQMLRIVSFSEPFFGLMIVLEGIFYGLGKTRYAFIVETFCMWGVRIFFTSLCVRLWHFDLRAVWYCMIADNVCKAVLFAIPMLRRKSRESMFVTDNN